MTSGKEMHQHNGTRGDRPEAIPIPAGRPAKRIEQQHTVSGEPAVSCRLGNDRYGGVKVDKGIPRDRREQVSAAGNAAEIMKPVAEPRSPGDFRGLIGEEWRGYGDHENKHRTKFSGKQAMS